MNNKTEKTCDFPPAGPHVAAQTSAGWGIFEPGNATTLDPMLAEASMRIDRFQIVRKLGEGGMGVVFLAVDTGNQSQVALKTIHPALASNPHRVRDFLREARRMAEMKHPRILSVSEVADRGAHSYYISPFMPGGSLHAQLSPGSPMPVERAVSIGIQVAEALSYAHDQKGVIHRDVKPQNVLLDARGDAVLCDFGLVRALGAGDESITDRGSQSRWTVGTRSYMAPELVMGLAGDYRVDVYSFGAMLYELLTGHKPYSGDTVEEVLAKIRLGPPTPVQQLNPQLPMDAVRVVQDAMARELRDRYSTMSDLLGDLKRISGRLPPIGAVRSPAVSEARTRSGRKLAVVAAMLMVGLAALVAYPHRHEIIAAVNEWINGTPTPPPDKLDPPDTVEQAEAYVKRLDDAIRKNDEFAAKRLLDALMRGDKRLVADDRFLLLTAVQLRREGIVNYICSYRPGILPVDESGNTPLHIAAMRDDVSILRILVEKGRIPVETTNLIGQTPMHLAAARGAKSAAGELLRLKSDVNAQDRAGNSPLHLAAAEGLSDMVDWLLRNGADRHCTNRRGQTPAQVTSSSAIREKLR